MNPASPDLFHAQHELVAFAHILGADLVVGVDPVVPLAVIHDGAGTDSADLLAGVGQVDTVGAGVGSLLQVVAVGADVDILDDLVGGGGVEVNGLAGLGSAVAGGDGGPVIGGVPEIVDAPAGLQVLGGIEGHRIVGIEGLGVVADVDGAVGRVAAERGVDVEIGALVDRHAEECVPGPLENEGGEGDVAQSLPDAVAAGVDIGAC